MNIMNTTNTTVTKTIQEVYNDYANGVYSNKETYPKDRILPPTHIFDENLSVVENREMVHIHNAKIDDARKNYRSQTDYLENLLRKDAETALMYEFGLTKKQAEIINGFVYREKHSSIYDYINCLHEYGELAKDLVNAK